MDPATFFIASFDLARPLDLAGAPFFGKDAGVLQQIPESPPRRACIPLSRPGTGCTLMLESLVMALIRQMPLNEAATILRNCDTRLWRLIEARAASGCAAVEVSGKKEVPCLNLFYDLDTSFTLQCGDGVVAKAQAGEQTGDRPGALRHGDSIEFAKALLCHRVTY